MVDSDGDGDLDDEEVQSTRPSGSKRGVWSSFAAAVRVLYEHGEPLEHPLRVWTLVREESETPENILFQVDGFRTGQVEIDGIDHDVVISDAHNDARFGSGDYWALRPAIQTMDLQYQESRKVGDFAWASGRAWKLHFDGADGRSGWLVEHETDLTQEQDEISRDHYRADREAPRAKVALTFRSDAEAAIAEARERGLPYFLDFWTDWCGP